MLYFIHPTDESTQFLDKIYLNAIKQLGRERVTFFTFKDQEPDEISQIIAALPIQTNIYFLGHGRRDRLYGIESESNEPFVSAKGMNIFNDKNLFTLACNSTELLTASFRHTNIKHAIGFGYLPTSAEEVQAIRNMRTKKITADDINEFKNIIVNCVSESIIYAFKKDKNFTYLNSLLRLKLHKEMNRAVLEKKNGAVANLIYQMCYQMSYFSN